MMHTSRKAVTAFLLTLALVAAIPGAALASDVGTTAESLTVASTVSMTAQATATYNPGDEDGANGPDYAAKIILTVLSSNNPSGVTVNSQVDPFVTGGGISVATTQRLTLLSQVDCLTGDSLSAPHADSTPPGEGAVNSEGFICPNTPAPVTRSGAVLTKAGTQLPVGTYATSSTVVPVASSTGPLANADLGVTYIVDGDALPVGGTYTSAVHWQTVTNP